MKGVTAMSGICHSTSELFARTPVVGARQKTQQAAQFVILRLALALLLAVALVPAVATGAEQDGAAQSDITTEDTAPVDDESEAGIPAEDETESDSSSPDTETPIADDAAQTVAPLAAPAHEAADVTVYVSSSGTDDTAGGTAENPYLTIAYAISQASDSQTTAVCVLDALTVETTADIGAKSIIIYGSLETAEGQPAPAPVVTGATSVNLFTVTTGTLVIEDITIDGASTMAAHQVATLTGGGSIALGDGATVQNWYSNAAYGAFYVNANGASFVMRAGSTIQNCSLIASGSYAGGAAINVAGGRNSDYATAPSLSYRASFTMEAGASIVGCATQLTANANMSGGGSVHAADTDIVVAAGASIEGSSLTYRGTNGTLINPSGMRQGGGGIFAQNCKITMAGTMANCTMVGQEDVSTSNFYAGGGAIYIFDYGCTTAIGVDCRTTVSGTITGCSAISGGGVFYTSTLNGYGEGDALWVGASGPLQSASEVVAQVNDTFILASGAIIADCSTDDMNSTRSASSLGSYVDYEKFGIGGGAICGAYTGLIVLEDGSTIRNCSTGTEGGGVSNWGTSVFCLSDSADLSTGPIIENCTSGGIAGGLSTGSSSSIEQVIIRGCTAGSQGGGMYVYSGSTTLYNCLIENCSAGTYGGGIMQNVVHDLYMYGGTILNNQAGTGGGGIALNGHSGGSLVAPRGLVFNYPAALNGGYTNPAYYMTTILQGKLGAPVIVGSNTQGAAPVASNVWTPLASATTRLSLSGPFSDGSKVGISTNDRAATSNRVGSQFASASQPGLELGAFANDVTPTLIPAYSGSNLVWQQGYVVDYNANWPAGETVSGEPPFDGVQGIQNAYPLASSATVLGQGSMVGGDHRFTGWSTDENAEYADYEGGDPIAYSAALDPDGDYRLALFAVWEVPEYVCQIIRDGSLYRQYLTLYEAFAAVQSNDRIEMLRNAPLIDFSQSEGHRPADDVYSVGFSAATGVVLTTAPAQTPTVADSSVWLGPQADEPVATLARTAHGTGTASYVLLMGGAALTTLDIEFDGRSTPDQTDAGTGVRANRALIELSGAQLAMGSGTRIVNAYNADATSGLGGGMYVGSGSVATVQGGAVIKDNATTGSGGGVFVDTGASLVLQDSFVTENRSFGTASGELNGSWVGGVGNQAGSVTVSGNAVVTGNLGARESGSAQVSQVPSDLETNASFITVADAGLGSGASIGITSANETFLQSGQQFAQAEGGNASVVQGLEMFFNNGNASLNGSAGQGAAVVWLYERTDVAFTKVGADQSTGLYRTLSGASFNVYRYVGAVDIDASSIADGRIDLASVSSTQWAPVLDDQGTEGTAGNAGNVPYEFVSSDGTGGISRGQVDLTSLQPGAWYMLVEAEAPAGYQKAVGQWAFRVHEVSAGNFTIDLASVLARPGQGGELPPRFASSVETADGALTGVLVINTPVFDLPFTGGVAIFPLMLLGLAFVACAVVLNRKRRKSMVS